MKLLLLTAFIAAVASTPLVENSKWPWQVGKEYVYDVQSYTWTKFQNSDSNGNAFKTQFVVRVEKPGILQAKLERPLYAQIKGQMDINNAPSDLKYQTVKDLDEVFEISVDGGRILEVTVPNSISSSNERILKGLVSALQVDLSTYGHVDTFPNSFDKETFQGLFKKTEADVTGDCETLYSVSPVSVEVRRELPVFAEDPIEITKSKNYGSCKKRVGVSYGVPEGAVWNGIAYGNDERQFIKHTSESRLLAGKQGTIYKSDVLSSVFVNPLLFGKQKSEIYSYVGFTLTEVKSVGEPRNTTTSDSYRTTGLLLSDFDESFFKVKAENVVNAQKLLQEMTPLLQDPGNLPKADFLSKFNLLSHFIMLMDSKQLTQMTSSIEVAKTSKNASKNKMWIIYRDAVAQAGTIAAFEEIKEWILTKKIQGEEAAEVISTVAGTMSLQTEKVAQEFFELAFNPKVAEQNFLNTSALLAATKFVRTSELDLFVLKKVIPNLSLELKKAVEQGDSNKAQLYVTLLGNLVRPEILKVFAPYLEGRIVVSKYLRIQMVNSLKPLANLKNEEVRAVLFSILKNTAEPYEVRVAAALNIFLAFPTAEMMQIMAHMTNDDPSTEVRGVLATSIGYASTLKDPRFAELAKTAQSVSTFINKEASQFHNSADIMIDDYQSNDDVTSFTESSYIGSENIFIPKYLRQAWRSRGSGVTEEDSFTLSVSDVQSLFDYATKVAYVAFDKSEPDFKFSAKKIVEELNIKREPRTPVEGSFFVDSLDQQRLFTFNERELEMFTLESIKSVNNLLTGVNSQYTKILVDNTVIVTFPLATGMPFVFVYTEPIIFIAGAKTIPQPDKHGSLAAEINFTYGRNMDGSVSFLDTFTDNYATTGIINKFQVNIPVKFTTTLSGKKVSNIEVALELPEQDVNLLHFSVTPYSSVQNKDSRLTIAEEPATVNIKSSEPIVYLDNVGLGELVGIGLNLKGQTYSSDFKKTLLLDTDILTNIQNLLSHQNDVAYTEVDLKYVAKDTRNKKITTSLFFDILYNQKEAGELGPAAVINDVTVNSEVRRKELVKRVAAGIESAKVRVVDISVVFDGELRKEFVLTGALASSVVDNKVQAVVFTKGGEQINAVFKITKSKIAPLNFEEALKNPIKVLYEADFRLGDIETIHIKGFGERSEEYTEKLKNDPLGKKCLEETSKNNFYQKDCYKMIIKAHAPDFFKATITSKDLNSTDLNVPNSLEGLANYFVVLERHENAIPKMKAKDETIEFIAQALYYDNQINYKIGTKYGFYRKSSTEAVALYPYVMVNYAPIYSWERYYNYFTGDQYLPYCAVDGSKISTFSGRSYDYSLSGSWHVVMVDESNEFKWTDLAILARRPSVNEEEVYISYKNDAGKYLEVLIKPAAVDVKSNAEKVSDGEYTAYWDNVSDSTILEYYTLAEGVQVFKINDEAIRILYDGQRLVIFTSDYRSTTRGICGQSSSQISDDYLTPYGLVDLPDLYGASFSLDGEFSDPKTVELKKEAKLKAYQPVTKYTNILRSDTEWSKAENESVKTL
ncbi:hypothetical protein PYW08_010745 [Mythimna loreyi]|uniref:Uncharacterized protein n=1 Tax=Mythimna loreyi TaxID=667449 RepID=A0ACC2Q4G3_9NEOP|nr:hypothetical protein PYW08_010745 [Mythimna loreyi]